MSERASALDVDAPAVLERCLPEFVQPGVGDESLKALEQEVAALETEHLRRPAQKLTLDLPLIMQKDDAGT